MNESSMLMLKFVALNFCLFYITYRNELTLQLTIHYILQYANVTRIVSLDVCGTFITKD